MAWAIVAAFSFSVTCYIPFTHLSYVIYPGTRVELVWLFTDGGRMGVGIGGCHIGYPGSTGAHSAALSDDDDDD